MRRSVVIWLLVAAAIVGALVLFGGPDDDGPPLDPSSTGPLGTKALVLLLEELGAEVDVTSDPPSAETDVVLLLVDDLRDEQRDDLRSFVDGGGTLVTTDPFSPLTPFAVEGQTGGVTGSDVREGCDAIPALAGVETVDPSGGVTFSAPAGASCFDGFVAVADAGSGTVAAVGGPAAFVNSVIGNVDNAELAASLLAPRDGTRVTLLRPTPAGGGQETLADLIDDPVRALLWQLGIAFLVYALWRARRLGRVVPEPQPVELPASDLVLAVGHLLERAGRADEAGRLLGDDLRRTLADRLGLGPDTPAADVAAVASARTGIPAERVYAALAPHSLSDARGLVALAAESDAIRQEVTHGNR